LQYTIVLLYFDDIAGLLDCGDGGETEAYTILIQLFLPRQLWGDVLRKVNRGDVSSLRKLVIINGGLELRKKGGFTLGKRLVFDDQFDELGNGK